MAKSSREEFIEAPKREFTRASAEEVLLDGSSSGGAGTGGPNIEGRSPLENFENMIPAAPSTESDLAVHELVEALSVILIFQWLPAEKGVKQSGESRFERRSERLNLAYEFKEGSNTYEWKYDSFMVYDGSGRFVDATVALSHSAEAFDPRIQNLMGTPGTTRPDIALERAFARIQLLDEAKKECPSLQWISDQSVEPSSFLKESRARVESWDYPTGDTKMPVIPEEGRTYTCVTLDTDSQRRCLQSKFEERRPKITVGPLSIHFHVDRPLISESAETPKILPRPQDLDDIKAKLREIEGKAATDLQLIIRGYADKQGTAERNERLSHARAEWVKRQIEAASLSKIKRIVVGGYGDTYSPDSPLNDQRFRVAVVEVLPLSQN